MSDNVIEAQNLTKRCGQTTVVKGISFSVGFGEIFGLRRHERHAATVENLHEFGKIGALLDAVNTDPLNGLGQSQLRRVLINPVLSARFAECLLRSGSD